MKSEKGLSLVEVIIILIIMIGLFFTGIKMVKKHLDNQKNEDIKANMLAIQTVITNVKNKHTIDETNNSLIGTKLNLENNETEYEINDKLKNILLNIENSNLYILNNQELIDLGVKNVNETKTEFYVIDYNSEDIIYSLGINEKYKLSEM